MEGTVEKLETMKAESDLDSIGRKLDVEFANDLEEADIDQMNPQEMLERLQDVKNEYTEVLKEAEEIRNLQKNAALFFQEQLMKACEAVAKLQLQSGEEGEQPEELNQVVDLLGLPSKGESGSPHDESQEGKGGGEEENPGEGTFCISSEEQKEVKSESDKKSSKASSSSHLSAYERRKDVSDCIDITEEEFMSVSELTRGRVKLEEVNRTYQMLWRHFREDGKTEPVGPSDMHVMGLRVSGTTGEAKLKVLRALKLIQISSKGAVKLL